MKIIAKLLLMAIILSMCFTLVSCSVDIPSIWMRFTKGFSVSILGIDSFSDLHFEIGDNTYMHVKLSKDEIKNEAYKNIEIKYNSANLVCEYAYASYDQVVFQLYCYELSKGDTFSITYNGKTIETTYTVSDFDFEANGYVMPTSIADLDKYPEFRDMLLSLKYHKFTDPYVGLWDSEMGRPPQNKEQYRKSVKYSKNEYKYYTYISKRENLDYIDTGYTEYIKDSMYYPEKFDTVLENPVSNVSVYLRFPTEADVSQGSEREEMYSFSISYSVTDPGCTNPKYPLHYMSFVASSKALNTPLTVEYGENTYPSQIAILLERYPEKFFEYKIGDTIVYILCHSSGGARAYFEDDTYFYSMSASYDN